MGIKDWIKKVIERKIDTEESRLKIKYDHKAAYYNDLLQSLKEKDIAVFKEKTKDGEISIIAKEDGDDMAKILDPTIDKTTKGS